MISGSIGALQWIKWLFLLRMVGFHWGWKQKTIHHTSILAPYTNRCWLDCHFFSPLNSNIIYYEKLGTPVFLGDDTSWGVSIPSYLNMTEQGIWKGNSYFVFWTICGTRKSDTYLGRKNWEENLFGKKKQNLALFSSERFIFVLPFKVHKWTRTNPFRIYCELTQTRLTVRCLVFPRDVLYSLMAIPFRPVVLQVWSQN